MEIFEFQFMQNAFIAAFLVAICSGIVGMLCVANRMIFLAGGIAHSAYGGVGIAFFLGVPIMLGASIFVIVVSLFVGYLMLKDRERTDALVGVIWAVGMAIGIIFADFTPGYRDELMSYLFGSLISVSSQDLWVLLVYNLVLIAFIYIYYYEILSVSYDSSFCAIKNLPVKRFNIILLLFIAIGVIMSMQSVGLILLIALFSIPAYMSEIICNSLKKAFICSSLLSFMFMVLGIYISFYMNLPIGPTIILIAASLFLLQLALLKIFKFVRKEYYERGT
ncbi:hypothetical protein CCZ01_00790 [Helicobacter monodelphidis]|uniref:metal ABC transporter permease n=1 Tax=Helicobacter sp. 15-1451 TaxID=2004995 RepID=UPI000DCBB773|nr:metal ABC transporter permease [Helicobacter sp. 15-1451]RAX59305.1 hypothetical protein CCZ01_00790 [Helicobacter sp. 15-1451]